MRLILRLARVAAFVLALPQAAISSEAPETLRWEEVARLVESHPAFSLAQQQVGVALGEIAAARQYPNPELRTSLGQSREKGGSGRHFIWNLELTIPVEWPGTYRWRQDAAKQGVAAARFDAQAARQEAFRELRSLYLAIALDQETEAAMSEAEAQLQRLCDLVRLRLEKGDARPMELARAEEEREELSLEANALRNEARLRKERLNLWLGGKLPATFVVEPEREAPPALPDLAETLRRVAEHPSAKAAEARQRQGASLLAAEKHAAVPAFGAGAFIGEEADSRNYGGLVTLSLPLWNWNLGGISKAAAEARLAEADAVLAKRRLREAVLAAHVRARSASEAIVRYMDTIMPKAKRTMEDVERLYQAGEIGLIEVLDARRALIRVRRGSAAARFDYQNALLDLALLTGGTPHA